jgi:hypothetical protein
MVIKPRRRKKGHIVKLKDMAEWIKEGRDLKAVRDRGGLISAPVLALESNELA